MSIVRRTLPGRLAAGIFVAILATGSTALPHFAAAQSLFDQLFNWGGQNERQVNSRPRLNGIAGQPLALRQTVVKATPEDAAPPTTRRGQSERRNGQYRTVCVRMCDGFYFPISNVSSRSNFYEDADACRSRCGSSEARLFYHANTGEMADAVDLAGRSYKSLSTAFLYRKKLVDGCACKPAPWSTAEVERHHGYAVAAGRAPASIVAKAQTTQVVAGNYSSAPVEVAVKDTTMSQPELKADSKRVVASVTEDGPGSAEYPVSKAETSASRDKQHRRERDERQATWAERSAERAERSASKPASVRREAKPEGKPQMPVRTASAVQPPRRSASGPSQSASSGGFVWPGDGPGRYR